jgi:KUP system potassium uptake protein
MDYQDTVRATADVPASSRETVPGSLASPSGFVTLTVGTLGVVYGDIGTSPLYALKEALSAVAGSGAVTRDMVFGIVSLILWALIFIVTFKYVLFILRADNNGEGGTLTLMALAQRAMGHNVLLITLLGMVGAALFYGDALITPAISVLSAVEGMQLVTPGLDPYVIPTSLVILVALFSVQSRGTARVGAWFGPITGVWFVLLAIGGLLHIADDPSVLAAISPTYGVSFLLAHGTAGFLALGAVFLAVTGAEALYADMGHFGRRPIQAAWLGLVLPSLALNYLGQGALLLADPGKIENPFFLMYPDWALLPMVIAATIATIIASQAVITGAFSLTQQAIQLGLLPRMEVRWTSETEKGQIYVPRVNLLLLVLVLFLVVSFRSSSALAHAYGIAVTGTMVVTAIMAFFVVWKCWRWSLPTSILVIIPFLLVDTIFLAANALKIPQGGWMPLVIGAVLVLAMLTWRRGTRILTEKTRKNEVDLQELIAMLDESKPHRVRGAAVFLTGEPETAPAALLHNLKHNKVLHEKNVILTVRTVDTPRVDDSDRVSVEDLGHSFWRVAMTFGYMEAPNIPRGLAILRKHGFKFDIMATSFFVSRRSIRPAAQSGMPLWQDKLFISLAKSASDATDFFQIPTGRVVEVGTQVTV